MLPCPFHIFTGLECPFCGGQRMLWVLFHGHWAEAFWFNPGLAIGAPLVVAWWLWKRELSSSAALVILFLSILWGVVRNIVPALQL